MGEIKKINNELHTIMTSCLPDGILLIADKENLNTAGIRQGASETEVHLVNHEFRRLFNLEDH
jgi:hypothetical protein